MRLVSYLSESGPRVAAVKGDGLVDLNRVDSSMPYCIKRLLAGGEAMLQKAVAVVASGEVFDRSSVQILTPVPKPDKIICIGINYADHARETGAEPPCEPVVFNKFVSAVLPNGGVVKLPSVSDRVDYEAELVVVIGKRGRDIAEADAMDYVAGYTCGNDISARDWQKGKPAGQWLLGKTFDTFAPFGPEMVTADEIADPGCLGIRLRLNGATMQDSNTDQLIFSVPKLISYISQVCTLEPGDVLFTGTPPGVGAARKPPVFLKPGDRLEVEIDGVGLLENTVE